MADQTSTPITGTPPTRKRKRATDRTVLSHPKPTRITKSTKSRSKKSRPIECPICLDPTPPKKLHTLTTCACTYCNSCLTEAFAAGLTNATYPTRCCGRPLDLPCLEKHIDKKITRAYKKKAEEMHANLPIYCAKPDCGSFIGEGETLQVQCPAQDNTTDEAITAEAQQSPDRFLTCAKCHVKTWALKACKQLHWGHLGVHAICPDSLEDKGVKKVREEKGWSRCLRCWVLTEKRTGCDRIRCMCKAEWCYQCGKMAKGKDGCVCRAPGYVELVGGDGEDVELPSIEQIFGIDEVVESVEVEG